MFRRNLRYRMFPKRRWLAVPVAWGYLLEVWETTQGDGLESLDHSHARHMDVIHVLANLIHFTRAEIEQMAGQTEMILLPKEYLEFNVLDPRYPEWSNDDELIDYFISDTCRAWRERGHRRHYRYGWWPKVGYENRILSEVRADDGSDHGTAR